MTKENHFLFNESLGIEGVFVEETGSTNSDLLNYVRTHFVTRPVLLCANRQTNGRGTRGKNWLQLGESLTFSLAIPVKGNITDWMGVTLAVGVGIAHALRNHGVPAQVKWPNDILLYGKKLSGILVETIQDKNKQLVFVIGVGINCVRQLSEKIDEVGYGVAFLTDATEVKNKMDWLEPICSAILSAIMQMETKGLGPTRESWDKISAYLNEPIWIYEEGCPAYQAMIRTIDSSGKLIVETENGLKSLISGTISLRKQ